MKDLESLFENYPILKNIDIKNNNVIQKNIIIKDLESEELISSKQCSGIIFIISGNINIKRINVNGEETNLYNLSKGELCHEALSCFLKYHSLNIIGKALTKSRICIIPFKIAKDYLFKDCEFLSYIYKDMYDKFQLMINKKEEKIHLSLDERIVGFLLNRNTKIIYITHKELAEEIDSSREVISRSLKKMDMKGYIKMERGKIYILKDLRELI